MPFPGDTVETDLHSHTLDMLPSTSHVHSVAGPWAMASRALLRGELRRGNLAPVPSYFPKLLKLFSGDTREQAWDSPMPTSCPSSAQVLHIEGDWDSHVNHTRQGTLLITMPLLTPRLVSTRVAMSGAASGHQDVPLWASPPPLIPQGLHPSQGWRQDLTVPWTG